MTAATHGEYCKYGLGTMATTGLWIHPVRIFQVIVAFVVSGLSAYVMLTLRFDYIIILMFSNGLWSACLATPILALQLETPNRVVHRIVILAVEWTTMLLWLVCFITLATISPPNHCGNRSCTTPAVILFLGAIEWYAISPPKKPETAQPYTATSRVDTAADAAVVRVLFLTTTAQRTTASLRVSNGS